MLQGLLLLMPHQLGAFALWMAMAGTCLGAGLWLAGARFSRSIITLLLVAIGSIVGKLLPGWMGWSIDPMATAVGGSVVLGASGYLLHRWWVGMGFGLVLALWAALGTWMVLSPGQDWSWPMPGDSFWSDLWGSLSPQVQSVLPFMAGAGWISGGVVALVWPRIGVVLLYSMTGLSLALAMGLAIAELGRPGWLNWVPSQDWVQWTALAVLVLAGAGVQWWLGPASAKSDPPIAQEPES